MKVEEIAKIIAMSIFVLVFTFSCAAASQSMELVELRTPSAMGAGILTTVDVLVKNGGASTIKDAMVVLEVGGKKGTSSYFSLEPSQIHDARVIFEAPEKAGTYLAVVKVKDKKGHVMFSKAFYLTFSPVSIRIEMPSNAKEGEAITVNGNVFIGSEPASGYVSIAVDGKAVRMVKVVDGKFSTDIIMDDEGVHEVLVRYGKNEILRKVYVEAAEKGEKESMEKLEMPVRVVASTSELQLIKGEGNMLKLTIKNNDQAGVFEIKARVVKGDMDVSVPAPFFMNGGEEKTVAVFINGKVVGEGVVEIEVRKNGEEVWRSDVNVRTIGESPSVKEVELPFTPAMGGIAAMFIIFMLVLIVTILARKRDLAVREPVSKEVRKIVNSMRRSARSKPLRLEEIKKAVEADVYPVRREQIIY